jgi:hypothetical protein
MRVRPRRKRPEDEIQKAVLAHLKIRKVPGVEYWHTPNGAKMPRIQAAILKGLGMRNGVADLLFLHKGKFYSLELKAPGRTSTDDQIGWRLAVNAAGGFAAEAVGLDAAIRILEAWQLLKGKAA